MGIKDAIVLRIKEICKQKGIKYNTLATNSGVTPSTVYKLDKTETEIANRNLRKNMIAAFLDELEKQEHLITDFDTGLWNAVIESMTIYSKEHIVFKFKGGTEIKWSIV